MLRSFARGLIWNNKKLKFYSMFKNDCHKSDCLNIITNINHNKTLKKFRLGNHHLQIETGRHTVPKLQKIFEFASSATLNEVEHELHFLFNCNRYESLWSKATCKQTRQLPILLAPNVGICCVRLHLAKGLSDFKFCAATPNYKQQHATECANGGNM